MTRAGEPGVGAEEQVLRVGALEVDPSGLCVRVGGVKMALPQREFQVLLVMAQNAGRILPAQAVLDHVWGPGFVDRSGTLRVHVNRLRRRLIGLLGVDYIRTVRGLGYALDPELARHVSSTTTDRSQ